MATSDSFAITGTEFDFQDSVSCCPNFEFHTVGLPSYSDFTESGQ